MTAGTGHRRAAEAIAQALRAQDPDVHADCRDFLDFTPPWFHSGYSWSYLFLVRYLSWVWKLSYQVLDLPWFFPSVQPLRRWWNLFITRGFRRWFLEQSYQMVVATHFLPADVCGAGKRTGWLRVPLIVVVTDLYPHRFWTSATPDAVVVATQESAAVCASRGIQRERIHVLGIPIGHTFSAPVDRRALQLQYGVSPDRHTILVTSGGTTVGQFERVVESLLALEVRLPGRLQLLVVCGSDEHARQRLEARIRMSAMPLQVFGFVETMAELMALSDLIVAKAGGLTISEALGRGVPLVLYHIIPGQEYVNAQYVSRADAAIIAHRPIEVAAAVRELIEHPDRLEAMRQAARIVSRPDAAKHIVSQVVNPLLQSRASHT